MLQWQSCTTQQEQAAVAEAMEQLCKGVADFPANAPAGKLIVKSARLKKMKGQLLRTTAMHLLNGDFPFEVCMAVGEFMSRIVEEFEDVYFFSALVIFFR